MQLFKLRYFQLRRDLGYWLMIIAFAVFFISRSVSEGSATRSYVLVAIILVFLYNYHLNRKDLLFISRYLNHPKLQVILNYNLLVLPVSVAFLSLLQFPQVLLLHTLVSLLPYIRLTVRGPKLLFLNKMIPAAQFEWISGLRRNFYLLAALYLVALILSPVKLFGVIALFLFNTILLSFYGSFEPLSMLNPAHLAPGEFLNRKVNFCAGMILLFSLPLLLVNSVFNPDVIWINSGFLLAFLLLAACAVHIKYAYYRPNETIPVSIDLLALYASVIIPYLLPVSLLIYFSTRKKAHHHLLQYTHDTH